MNKYAGGNPVCIRPTPGWQKNIDMFFTRMEKDQPEACTSGKAEEEEMYSKMNEDALCQPLIEESCANIDTE